MNEKLDPYEHTTLLESRLQSAVLVKSETTDPTQPLIKSEAQGDYRASLSLVSAIAALENHSSSSGTELMGSRQQSAAPVKNEKVDPAQLFIKSEAQGDYCASVSLVNAIAALKDRPSSTGGAENSTTTGSSAVKLEAGYEMKRES